VDLESETMVVCVRKPEEWDPDASLPNASYDQATVALGDPKERKAVMIGW